MKIAVTYDNGNIFQHFGKTEFFKVYEVEDGKVVSSEVIGSNGVGHGALAGLLADRAVDVLICGGIGGGAQAALEEAVGEGEVVSTRYEVREAEGLLTVTLRAECLEEIGRFVPDQNEITEENEADS